MAILQLTYDPQHPIMVDGVGPDWREAGGRWRAFRNALALDADATMPDAAPASGPTA